MCGSRTIGFLARQVTLRRACSTMWTDDTHSQELSVFCQMPKERLRVSYGPPGPTWLSTGRTTPSHSLLSGKLQVQNKFLLFFFFYCIAELAIKPCRSSRSKMRGEFGTPKHLQNRKQKHNKATTTPTQNTNTKKQGHGKCLEGETRGEKRVKRPKRPNALICRFFFCSLLLGSSPGRSALQSA